MPPKPPPPLPGAPRGRLPSVREVDARPERQSREPTLPGVAPAAPGSVAPPADQNAWNPEDTGHRAADSLVLALADKTRTERELRQQLAEARAQAPQKPPAVESEPPPVRRRGRARETAAKALGGLVIAVLGGTGGTEGLKAIRGRADAPAVARVQAQVDDLRADQAKNQARIEELERYLAAAYDDEDCWRLLVTAYACSQRRLLASGVDCSEVLSVVPVNPSPLTAAKPLPQLVIPGPRARKPEPRLPPKAR